MRQLGTARNGKYRVVATQPTVTTVAPGRGHGSTQRLLEREAVLADLRALARGLQSGLGQTVLLRGEAGVGKTTVTAVLALSPLRTAPPASTEGRRP